MRRSLGVFAATIACATALWGSDVTVVVTFDGAHSDRSVDQMKREAEAIVKESGIHLDWRSQSQLHGAAYPNLVLIRFKGVCMLDPSAQPSDARGAFAATNSTDGKVMPFAEVECDHVAASARSAMWGDDFARPDYLMGRALGRVVAHELVHMLTASSEHGSHGIAQPALTGGQLIGAPLRLSRDDMERLRRGFAGK